ncbi:MAG: dienelactone hydrolase family protein [Rhodocyclales bacterium]|nr:dienelactone hydrolase family protein [Rhodocyclales bacterium]
MSAPCIEVLLPAAGACLPGTLTLPAAARGLVVFAHGSGSSRLSPRNVFVAEVLHGERIATLLFDLLTPEEDLDYAARFDIALLTERLLLASDWLAGRADVGALALGYFGASTGAAAALQAAARRRPPVAAVVSRGGRPDLAGAEALAAVASPTLLIVGGDDEVVLELNREALALLGCDKRLVVVPGATHLFEEPGTLAAAARHAADWFARCFG